VSAAQDNSGEADYKDVIPLRQAVQYSFPSFPVSMREKRTGMDSAIPLSCCKIAAFLNSEEPILPGTSTNASLSGQVAVITGAGRGIGAAIATRVAELGARTVLCGRSRDPLEALAAKIQNQGGQSAVVDCNVCDLRSVEGAAVRVERTFGKINILVNNAGIGGMGGPLHQLPPEIWDQVINTNLRGAYYCIRSFAPLMMRGKSGGHIINISSIAGKNPLPNGAAYAASKWGLNGLSYSVAEELRGSNIRVSVICPGSTHTEFSPHAGMATDKMLQATDVAHAVAMIVTQAPQSFASEIILRPTQKP
jgi:3-oxoacyl-[acyl-carrier protein] reductase